MIGYQTYCKIGHLAQSGFSAARIALETGINEKTVRKWMDMPSYRQRKGRGRDSKLEPFKPAIKRWIEQADFSLVQIHQKLQDGGYAGGVTIVGDYLRIIRPRRRKAYRTVCFPPGEACQVDWGTFGSMAIGSTRRKLSFLTVVLCHSRMLYVEFFAQERMEHFLAGLANAFAAFNAVPRVVIVDNLKSAVLQHRPGCDPEFNPRFVDFCNHYATRPFACTPYRPYEKGQVESGVGYVKGNFLRGRSMETPEGCDPLELLNRDARLWAERRANLRDHREIQCRPLDLFERDRAAMLPYNINPYDTSVVRVARVTNRCRVHCDSNRYSVPPRFSSRQVQLHVAHDRLCIYYQSELIALHTRTYDRHRQIVDPDHERELAAEGMRSKQVRELEEFEALAPSAPVFLANLRQTRFGYMHHVRRILALAGIHGVQAVVDAMAKADAAGVHSSESILNLIEQRQRHAGESALASPVSATAHSRRLLEIRLSPPDLAGYPGTAPTTRPETINPDSKPTSTNS